MMTVTFSHGENKLTPAAGLPARYKGYILSGAEARHFKSRSGIITLQQLTTPLGGCRILHINAKRAHKIKCHYQGEEKWLCIRTVPDQPVTELIKGSGKQRYDEKQFNMLCGTQWQSLIDIDQHGEYVFFDLMYKEKRIPTHARNEDNLKIIFDNAYEYVPARFAEKKLFLTLQMHRVLTELRNEPITRENHAEAVEEKMLEYLNDCNKEVDGYGRIKLRISERHWNACEGAVEYIKANLDKQFTIPQLGLKVGMSATGLKQAFPRIYDFTIDDYHRYLRLKRTFKILSDPKAVVKSVVALSGYGSAPTFTAAFKKAVFCTPSEFNNERWDTSNL